MQYLFDESGRRYLDAFGCIATVSCGHCHPQVLEAIINQTKKLQHTTALYLNRPIVDFAEALASKTPGDLNVIISLNQYHKFINFTDFLYQDQMSSDSKVLFMF